jgi:hypothetical protein
MRKLTPEDMAFGLVEGKTYNFCGVDNVVKYPDTFIEYSYSGLCVIAQFRHSKPPATVFDVPNDDFLSWCREGGMYLTTED